MRDISSYSVETPLAGRAGLEDIHVFLPNIGAEAVIVRVRLPGVLPGRGDGRDGHGPAVVGHG